MTDGLVDGTHDHCPGTWPDRAPKDLALRLADALLYPDCRPDDLWDEIGDWLNANEVAAPCFPSDSMVAAPDTTGGYTKFRTVSQSGSATALTRLIYSSHHSDLDIEVFDNILSKSRENNARDSITGALVISEDGFMQLLQGSRCAVGQCFFRIMMDNRHDQIQVVSCGDVNQRLFKEWTMHLIRASRIKQEIMSHYLIDGAFRPDLMSEFALADLCRTLSDGDWDAEAA